MAEKVDLYSIWQAIQQVKVDMTAHLDNKIETIQTGLINIQGTLSSMCEQIAEVQQRVSANEDNISDLTKRVQALEKENIYLRDKAEEAENRSRSSNLRFIGIPEHKEGRDVIAFMSQLILQLLDKDNFSVAPVIERAHRTPTFSSNTSSAPPRPILVKFLHFQDKVKILRLARMKGELIHMGARIHVYPDFSAGLVKKRRQFDAVKKSLRVADMKYSLMYPAKLRVMVEGKPKIFSSPEEAESFFQHLSSPSSLSSSPG